MIKKIDHKKPTSYTPIANEWSIDACKYFYQQQSNRLVFYDIDRRRKW